jgi:putative oxygen-independent coproporphyrinogen III oxidase
VPGSLYLHVPFCAARCGYCDFNTYTASELGASVDRGNFHQWLIQELDVAAQNFHEPIDTVFIGGGTPTLIGAAGLTALLDAVRDRFNLMSSAEITTEANPDSVDPPLLTALREAGFNRISFGMQSAAPHVLRTLDRTHTPGMAHQAALWARAAGFTRINIDLMYGTPGESDDDVRDSITEVLDAGVDHVSAYALIVENGTALARRIDRGEITAPDDDIAADRYELIDDLLTASEFTWYEISNWARPGSECRHNFAYWEGRNWWGIGPGAHSHLDGVRWWNVKHPARYAERLASGDSVVAEREPLTEQQRSLERIMLGIRTSAGLPSDGLPNVDQLVGAGLLERAGSRVRLTRSGRLLANRVVDALTDAESETADVT